MAWLIEWAPLTGGGTATVGDAPDGGPLLPHRPGERRGWHCVASTASGDSRLYALGTGARRHHHTLYAVKVGGALYDPKQTEGAR